MLFDGVCRFCNGVVQWVLRHDRAGVIHFAPLQSPYALALLREHPELQGVDSLMLRDTDGRVLVRSDAALRVAGIVGGRWRIFRAGLLLPRGLRDRLYDAFAKRRYRWFGKSESCMRPTLEMMARFVDTGP
jgi:predicted DCC family thiol-disulfide oxidoreductase YuxK